MDFTDEHRLAHEQAWTILAAAAGSDQALVDLAIEQAIARLELVPHYQPAEAVETVMAYARQLGIVRARDLRGFV
jgi:hypothetical protein